jgi:ATP-dependent DNA helicase RecG
VPRRYRNRRIGEFLKELDLTEGRATGIPKILRAMRQNGSPPPEFDFDEDHSYFQVRLPVHPEARTLEAGPGGHPMTDPVIDPVIDPVTEEAFDPLIRLLLVIGEGELSPSEIQRRLNLKHRPTFRQNYLYPALEKGLIEMTRPDKPSSRLQQYKVTVKGRAWLDEKGESRAGGVE